MSPCHDVPPFPRRLSAYAEFTMSTDPKNPHLGPPLSDEEERSVRELAEFVIDCWLEKREGERAARDDTEDSCPPR